jgi:hypothetical protein
MGEGEVHMSDLHSRTLKLASELPVGDPTRRKILAALKGAGSAYTMLVFSNPKAAMSASSSWEDAEDEESPNRSAPQHLSAETWAVVNKKTGQYESSSGGQGNAVLVRGDVPWLINTVKEREPRLKFVVFDKVEPPRWDSRKPPTSVDLKRARRP